MKLKTLGFLLPAAAAVACSAPAVISHSTVSDTPDTFNLGNGTSISLNDGRDFAIAFGGMAQSNTGLHIKTTTAPTAVKTSPAPTFNNNGFIVLLSPKTTSMTFGGASNSRVWIFAKGSAGKVLMLTGGLSSGAPAVTMSTNYDGLYGNEKQLAVKIPAGLSAGSYSLVVTDTGTTTAPSGSAASGAMITVTDTASGTNDTSWYNPISGGSAAVDAI